MGVVMTALGVGAEFALEHHSFYSTQDFLFTSLDRVSVPMFCGGICLAFVGALAWAGTFSRGKQLATASVLFGIGSLIFGAPLICGSPLGFHDWTGSLLLIAGALWGLGLLLAVTAAFKRG